MSETEPYFGSILDVLEYVLSQRDRPASAEEIAESVRKDPKLSSWLKGRTPAKTVQARISVDILENRRTSRFYRYAPAMFGLRQKMESGKYPHQFSRKYLFWRRRRRELSHSYIACVNTKGSVLWNVLGFLNKDYLPLNILRHLNIKLFDRRESFHDIEMMYFKRLRYYYCIKYEDKVVRYKRSNFDAKNEGRTDLSTIGFDGWITENHISMFSDIGFDISATIAADTNTIFGGPVRDLDINFLGFINDESDRRNKGIIALAFVVSLKEYFDFDEVLGMRDVEWIGLRRGANQYHNLENWSKYMYSRLIEFEYQ